MQKWTPAQPDLFEEEEERRIQLTPPQRVKALELLQALLTEAIARPVAPRRLQELPGVSDDEDHA